MFQKSVKLSFEQLYVSGYLKSEFLVAVKIKTSEIYSKSLGTRRNSRRAPRVINERDKRMKLYGGIWHNKYMPLVHTVYICYSYNASECVWGSELWRAKQKIKMKNWKQNCGQERESDFIFHFLLPLYNLFLYFISFRLYHTNF